jgi:hypothetical protein
MILTMDKPFKGKLPRKFHDNSRGRDDFDLSGLHQRSHCVYERYNYAKFIPFEEVPADSLS